MKEKCYIFIRKLRAIGNIVCFMICRIFPIDRNCISVCTFEGKGGFGCNPKYIVKKLHELNSDIKFVWFVNKETYNKAFPDYIKKVPNTFWNRAFWLSRSKIWIDNYRKPYGTCKRKGQYYINTWHANIGFKSIGLGRGKAFSKMAYLVSANDSKMIDRVVIDSDFCDELFRKGLLFYGEYLKVGQPRCDILFERKPEIRESFIRKYALSVEDKIVMFAPTFREGVKNGKRSVFSEVWSIDFELLRNSLSSRFGGNWIVCVRVHPQLARDTDLNELIKNNRNIVDASMEDDMYEVLAAMDAFITDYSSAAMDACCCKMPVFIYADDIDKYIADRGNLLWDFSQVDATDIKNNKQLTPSIDATLPFTISKNNEELVHNIKCFDEQEYDSKLEKYFDDVGMIFDGNASTGVALDILRKMK